MEQVAALIGDVVGSRLTADRAALHGALQDALVQANRSGEVVTPLRITVGDEYQGCFRTVGAALQATLRLRLALRGRADVRHGVARGPVAVLSAEPRVEDGEAWWDAREAIEHVKAAQQKALRPLRTAYRCRTAPAHETAMVNAALVGRDDLVGRLDERGLSVLDAMLQGMKNVDIARMLGITPTAVSQRRRNGVAAIAEMDRLMGGFE